MINCLVKLVLTDVFFGMRLMSLSCYNSMFVLNPVYCAALFVKDASQLASDRHAWVVLPL